MWAGIAALTPTRDFCFGPDFAEGDCRPEEDMRASRRTWWRYHALAIVSASVYLGGQDIDQTSNLDRNHCI